MDFFSLSKDLAITQKGNESLQPLSACLKKVNNGSPAPVATLFFSSLNDDDDIVGVVDPTLL